MAFTGHQLLEVQITLADFRAYQEDLDNKMELLHIAPQMPNIGPHHLLTLLN